MAAIGREVGAPVEQVPIPVQQMLIESAHRRIAGGEIRRSVIDLGRVFERHAATDEVSIELSDWQQRFMRALDLNIDAVRIQNEFARRLQALLTDPIGDIPLDEEPVLASDGRTYGHRSLCVYLAAMPAPYNHRSPIDRDNEAMFFTAPSLAVGEYVRWLHERNIPLEGGQEERLRQVNEAYALLGEGARILPTRFSEMRRILQEQQELRDREEEADIADFGRMIDQEGERLSQLARQAFEEARHQVEADGQRHYERLDAIEQMDVERRQAIQGRIEVLENEVVDLERQNEALNNQLHEMNGALNEIERQNAQLQVLINETDIALKKREQRKWKSLAMAVCVTVVCFAATYYVGGGAFAGGSATSSSRVLFVPRQNGIGIVIPK